MNESVRVFIFIIVRPSTFFSYMFGDVFYFRQLEYLFYLLRAENLEKKKKKNYQIDLKIPYTKIILRLY